MQLTHPLRLAAIVFAFALAGIAGTAAAAKPLPTNRMIVVFSRPEEVGTAQLERLSARAGIALKSLRGMSYHARVLALPGWVSGEAAAGIAARLAADPAVEYAAPDRLNRPAFVPNDTLYPQQWNLYEDAGGVRLADAWDRERGAGNIVIALLDSGILPHGDLDPARMVPGYDFIDDRDQANDGDGRDADPSDPGDWVAANECGSGLPAESSSWHGTQVAGLIGASSDNAAGIAGVNHGSQLLMARVLGKCGGFTSDVVDALRWVAGLNVSGVPDNPNPARVINLSLGGDGPCTRLEQRAIDEVSASGAVVVVAAGNGAADVADHSPANCSGVITVAATTRSGSRAAYTNTGIRVVLSAPGGDAGGAIPSLSDSGTTVPAADDYRFLSGTSFAAAHVSGIASLVLSANGDLNPLQVRQILSASARPFTDSSCDPSVCGAGIVDANAAVVLAAVTQGQPDSDLDGVNDALDLCPRTPAVALVNADGCSPGQLNSNSGGGGGGGGGCTLSAAGRFDPLLPLLVLFSVLAIAAGWRVPGRGTILTRPEPRRTDSRLECRGFIGLWMAGNEGR
ncbi:MAG: S8 family peptidase [Gammaproteobacteria bacterium]|jgi:serine protease